MKVYNDEDSEEWSFSEDDADIVAMHTCLDDGRFVLDDDQLQDIFNKAVSEWKGLPESASGSGGSGASVAAGKVQSVLSERDKSGNRASASGKKRKQTHCNQRDLSGGNLQQDE